MRRVSKVLSISILIILLTTSIVYGNIDVSENIKGALLGDVETGEIFYSYNIEEEMEIASITKLMTYLLLRDAIEANQVSINDDVTISRHAANTEGSSFGLIEGESIKLSTLINALLVVSGNDVATAVAEHVAGTEEKFIEMMYDKAEEIGITSARFINPHGMPIDDEETDQNYMSIEDIFKLSSYVLKTYPDIVEITSQQSLVIPERNFDRKATNQLLSQLEGVDGLKTGYTDKAGVCLVSTMPVINEEDTNKNFRLVAIVMGAQDHEDKLDKSKELLLYGYENYFIEKLVDKEELADTILINNAKEIEVDVYPSDDFYKLIKTGTNVKSEMILDSTIEAPLSKGDAVGKIVLYIGDEEIGQVDALINRDVEKANIFVRIFRFIKGLLGI